MSEECRNQCISMHEKDLYTTKDLLNNEWDHWETVKELRLFVETLKEKNKDTPEDKVEGLEDLETSLIQEQYKLMQRMLYMSKIYTDLMRKFKHSEMRSILGPLMLIIEDRLGGIENEEEAVTSTVNSGTNSEIPTSTTDTPLNTRENSGYSFEIHTEISDSLLSEWVKKLEKHYQEEKQSSSEEETCAHTDTNTKANTNEKGCNCTCTKSTNASVREATNNIANRVFVSTKALPNEECHVGEAIPKS